MIIKLAFAAAILVGVCLGKLGAQTQHIVADQVYTGTESTPDGKTIITLTDGRISEITARPPGHEVEIGDITGAWVTPGLFIAASRMGLVEVSGEDDTDDRGASNAKFSVALKAVDGFNPSASAIAISRQEGVTYGALVPTQSGNIFAGTGGIVSTSGTHESIIQDEAFIFVRLGEAGARLAGGSRAAAMAYLRAALRDARTYPSRYSAHADGGEVLPQADARALTSAAKGNRLILVAVSRAADIRQVIALAKQSPQLDIALLGAAEAHLVADELAEASIPVIIAPTHNLPSRFETLHATLDNAATLISAGVLTSFALSRFDAHQARLLPQIAGLTVANGVKHEDALAAITTIPAEIFDLPALGRIARGDPANLVVWDGDPLELSTRPIAVFIDGKIQSLESRQTALRDRYIARLNAPNN